ncbi:MAG: V-type ATP synthase subunit D [Candidatus Aminicenantes bacterium]|nr:V-type ATP synthase subunit D [Candidatus Aminicenantes bacterium]
MAKAQLTKSGLKREQDDLKRYLRFLPTLELKKLQLLAEIRRVRARIEQLERESLEREKEIRPWAAVFAEETEMADWIRVSRVRTSLGNIAGIGIPILEDIEFEAACYDLRGTPLWVDRALPIVREEVRLRLLIGVALEQQAILRRELRTTIQRIKLFEEVKIPEAREAIRAIQIFLGDLRTAEVVRGKIAKAKIELKRAAEAAGSPV